MNDSPKDIFFSVLAFLVVIVFIVGIVLLNRPLSYEIDQMTYTIDWQDQTAAGRDSLLAR